MRALPLSKTTISVRTYPHLTFYKQQQRIWSLPKFRTCSRRPQGHSSKGIGHRHSRETRSAGPLPTARGIQRIVKQYVKKLGQSITINKAILTGSWATGTQREDSDVDLIIISDDFSKTPFSERLSYLHKKWTNKVPFEAFGYTKDEFRQMRQRSTYVRDAIRNGLVLDESGSWHTGKRFGSA